MRLIMMQLERWSPNTFHTVWNAGNCEMYVLELDLTRPGLTPYIISPANGELPRSTIDLLVHFAPEKTGEAEGKTQMLPLQDFLSLPPPRVSHHPLYLFAEHP